MARRGHRPSQASPSRPRFYGRHAVLAALANPDRVVRRIWGTREALSAMTDPAMGPRRAVLALGYAGWGDGQLEEEIADNVWLTAEADLDVLFDTDFDTKWTRALAGLGVDAARLSSQSGRA